MKGQAGLWDVDERLAQLSAAGDPLERLNTVVAWEMFRKPLTKALNRPDRAQGGRPPYDAVMMFKILVLDCRMHAEFQIGPACRPPRGVVVRENNRAEPGRRR